MMLWTVYYTVTKIDDSLVYLEHPSPSKESLGIIAGGNCKEVIEKTCDKVGHPIRFDKDVYEPGSYDYTFTRKDPSTLVTICHCIQVAPVGDLLELSR